MRHTKIIATVGPATNTDAMLDAIIAAGTDVVRLNFSHGTQQSQGETYARVKGIARRTDVPMQDFVTRTNIGCGSTIGPITASRLGVPMCDVGAPMLSMHSAREYASTDDHARYVALLSAHLTEGTARGA